MSQASAQALAFYEEVARERRLWSILDARGYPAPLTPEVRAMPIWSSLERAERIIESVDAYRRFTPIEISWNVFANDWLPGLDRDGIRSA